MHDIIPDDDLEQMSMQVSVSSLVNKQRRDEPDQSNVFPVSTKGTPSSVPIHFSFLPAGSSTSDNGDFLEGPRLEHNLIEFHKPISIKNDVLEAGLVLHRKMLSDNSQVIRDIITPHNVSIRFIQKTVKNFI